jgi:prophage regulatory protein
MNQLPEIGYLRLPQIIGNPKKGIPPLIPISRSTFWERVRTGIYPKGVLLGPRIRAWKVEDVRALIANTAAGDAA